MSNVKAEIIIVTPKNKRTVVMVERMPFQPSPSRVHLVRRDSRAVRKLNFDANTSSTGPT